MSIERELLVDRDDSKVECISSANAASEIVSAAVGTVNERRTKEYTEPCLLLKNYILLRQHNQEFKLNRFAFKLKIITQGKFNSKRIMLHITN